MEGKLRLILGDQLNINHSWFSKVAPNTTYVLCEQLSEATYTRHHIQKLVGFFAAMRSFAVELERLGHQVIYFKINDPSNQQDFSKNINQLITAKSIQKFEYQLPDEYRLDEYFKKYCMTLKISYEAFDTEHFYTTRTDLLHYFKGKKNHTMEFFYRNMRKNYGILLNLDGSPYGGKWNFDSLNQKKWNTKSPIPSELKFSNNVAGILADIKQLKIETIGTIQNETIALPITRSQALKQLEFFCTHLLMYFGDYQDAMHTEQPFLFHSKLSFALNLKLISPKEIVQHSLSHYKKNQDKIHISQLEGFIRQILGWREYMRGMYWKFMPDLKQMNYFNHTHKLPEFYWTAKTKMNCLKCAVQTSLDFSYAHHIQRLMILGNFALLSEVNPDELDEWFLGIYMDAVQWVQLPNTRGMSQYADGGLIATKPYVSAASYVNRMSDYCKGCHYDHNAKTGDKSCPFNSLYWNFLIQKRPLLNDNNRMKMMFSLLDKKSPNEVEFIQDRARDIIQHPDRY